MNTAIFRPSFAPLLWSATFWLALSYAALLALAPADSWWSDYPFAVAMAVGALRLAWQWWQRGRHLGIAVTDLGVTDLRQGLHMSWSAVDTIAVELTDIQSAQIERSALVVTVQGTGGAFSFADLGTLGPAVDAIQNLPSAPELLAVIVAKTRANLLYPSHWREASRAATSARGAAIEPAVADNRNFAQRFAGVFGLAAKLVPKVGTTAVKLLTVIKPGAAVLTLGVYSALVSWQFALSFILMVGFHECGHVYAMWRCGVPVKGIYFVPFLGGVAVGQARASTAAQEAFIALNGPVWGTALTLLLLGLDFAIQPASPTLKALAAWGALMNLFNLLPVSPLDGGQVLAAVVGTRSFAPRLVGAMMGIGVVLAYVVGLELLVLAVGIGLAQWVQLLRISQEGAAFGLVKPMELDGKAHEHFYRHASLLFPAQLTEARVEQRRLAFERLRQSATMPAMNRRQVMAVVLGYVALVAILLSILLTLGDSIDVGQPTAFLR